jgi:hypothetical protein
MKRYIWIIILVIFAVAALFATLFNHRCFFSQCDQLSENDQARTLYDGTVKINLIDLHNVTDALSKMGCSSTSVEPGACTYYFEKDTMASVYPRGKMFGPSSIDIYSDKVNAIKDIDGKPDYERYESEVRADISGLLLPIVMREDTWNISTKYPWNAIY